MSLRTEEEKREREEACNALGRKLIDLCDEDIVQSGRWTAADAIYIITSTLAKVSALIIFGQMGNVDDDGAVERMKTGFKRVFDSDSDGVIAWRRAKRAGAKEESAWDREEDEE